MIRYLEGSGKDIVTMHQRNQRRTAGFTLTVLGGLVVGLGLLIGPTITIWGIPIPMLIRFLSDQPAREAYFAGQPQTLHDRLDQLGFEEDIKAYYRPKIQNEAQLDQYIHQLFYDTTGYISKGYNVDANGVLILKNPQFERWYRLATQAGVVSGYQHDNGIYYVTSPNGAVAPYEEIAAVYPISLLQQLIKIQ